MTYRLQVGVALEGRLGGFVDWSLQMFDIAVMSGNILGNCSAQSLLAVHVRSEIY